MGFGGGSTGLTTPLSFAVEVSVGPETVDDLDLSLNALGRSYSFFTLPVVNIVYKITGIEWKNGAVVAGNVIAGLDVIESVAPTNTHLPLRYLAKATAQAGANAVQRVSFDGPFLKGGSVIASWITSNNAAGLFRKATGTPNVNRFKATAYTATPATADNAAWATSTDYFYQKIYMIGLSG